MEMPTVAPEVIKEIERAIQSIRYGTVEITIHGARVVQIERSEKIRFQNADLTSGGTLQTNETAQRKTAGGNPNKVQGE